MRFKVTLGGREYEITRHDDGTFELPPELKQWDGWNTALKPGWEPIVLARKPLIGTVAANVAEHGTGALNIDACRIAGPKGDGVWGSSNQTCQDGRIFNQSPDGVEYRSAPVESEDGKIGRWPANVVLSHSESCKEVGVRKVKSGTAVQRNGGGQKIGTGRAYQGSAGLTRDDTTYADADGTETVAAWECAPDCPVRLLDEQSGERKAGMAVRHRSGGNTFGGDNPKPAMADMGYGDTGGSSRFFYTSKASRAEREFGLENLDIANRLTPMAGRGQPGLKCRTCGRWKVSGSPCECLVPDFEPSTFERPVNRNSHPTVKPLALMKWLVRLVTPPNGLCLDPFAGSGTTGVACVKEGFRFLGMEREPDYVAIARARIAHARRESGQVSLFDGTEA